MVLPHTPPGLPTKRPPQTPAARVMRDVTWDRPVFRPPSLNNWRVIFDPMPFRHHDFRRPAR